MTFWPEAVELSHPKPRGAESATGDSRLTLSPLSPIGIVRPAAITCQASHILDIGRLESVDDPLDFSANFHPCLIKCVTSKQLRAQKTSVSNVNGGIWS